MTYGHDGEPGALGASGAIGPAVEEVDALAEDALGGEEGGAEDELLEAEHFGWGDSRERWRWW